MMTSKYAIYTYYDFLKTVEQYLPNDIAKESYNIEVGIWEVAFEVILIELIKLPRKDVSIDFSVVEFLAKDSNIVEVGFLDDEIWPNFLEWYHSS